MPRSRIPSGMSNTATDAAQPRAAPDSVLLTLALVVLAAGVMLVCRRTDALPLG